MKKSLVVLLFFLIVWGCNGDDSQLLYLENKNSDFSWEVIDGCNCPKPPLSCPIRLKPRSIEGLDLAYQWEIGNDTLLASTNEITYEFESSQWHTVNLRSYHLNGKLQDATQRIPIVHIDFEYVHDDCVELPCPTRFVNISDYPNDLNLEFEWDFGDGWKLESNQKTVNYTFEQSGLHEVRLNARYNDRAWKTQAKNVLIKTIDFSCHIESGFSQCVTIPCTATFINKSVDLGLELEYRWLVNNQLADLNIDVEGNLKHEFTSGGLHYVSLQAIDASGIIVYELKKVISVQEVKADFEIYPDTCTLDAILNECVIRFENTSVDYEPFAFEWIFLHSGRKDTTQIQTPYQGYKRDSTYYVRLNIRETRARDSKVIDSVTKSVVILRAPLPVNFFELDSAILHYTPRNWNESYDSNSVELTILEFSAPPCIVDEIEFLRKYHFNACNIPVDLGENYEFVLSAENVNTRNREIIGHSRIINFKDYAAIEKVRPNTSDRIYISNPDNTFIISIDGRWK